MGFIEKQKECNSKKRIVLLHSGECNSILLLHSWEIELSIRHHVTKINQLNDLNLTRYYINIYIYIYMYTAIQKRLLSKNYRYQVLRPKVIMGKFLVLAPKKLNIVLV